MFTFVESVKREKKKGVYSNSKRELQRLLLCSKEEKKTTNTNNKKKKKNHIRISSLKGKKKYIFVTASFIAASPLLLFVRLVGATDPRVVGIAPIVMPILSLVENINHQWRACKKRGTRRRTTTTARKQRQTQKTSRYRLKNQKKK